MNKPSVFRSFSSWSISSGMLILFLSIPLLSLLFLSFNGPGESWGHILETQLGDYLINTIQLLLYCASLTFLLGVAPAYVISFYDLRFRKSAAFLLILPLAIPVYIMAYAYVGFFDYGGIWAELFYENSILDAGSNIDIMNVFGLSVVLSLALYPYVFLAALTVFNRGARPFIDVCKSLNIGESKRFFSILLPLAFPAIFGGLILVMMEVLNDYGAAYYFGVKTFSTGIFRSWFSLEEPATAIYLAILLCIFVFIIMLLKKLSERRKYFTNHSIENNTAKREKIGPAKKAFAYLIILIPIILALLLPMVQLLKWLGNTWKHVYSDGFIGIVFQSFLLASLAAVLICVFAILIIKIPAWNRNNFIKSASSVSLLGYALPGAVIAVGIIVATLSFDRWLIEFAKEYFQSNIGLFFNGGIVLLVYAYIVRFLAVGQNPIHASFEKFGKQKSEMAYSLSKSRWKALFSVELPNIKPGLLAAFILVFIDVLKELPLTLLLKPYNYTTLAVKSFEYASDERIAECALPSLLIILIASIPIVFLNRSITT